MDILPPKHETVTRDGTRLHVARLEALERPERSGRGDRDGRTLLFLHGWPEFWWTYAPVMERLAAAGYDCVAPDLRGFGDSDKPPEGRSAEVGPGVHAADALACLLHEVTKRSAVDTGDGDVRAQPVDDQQAEGEENAVAKVSGLA